MGPCSPSPRALVLPQEALFWSRKRQLQEIGDIKVSAGD